MKYESHHIKTMKLVGSYNNFIKLKQTNALSFFVSMMLDLINEEMNDRYDAWLLFISLQATPA